MIKRLLTILLTVCMILPLIQPIALAASNPSTNTFDISEGDITITNGTTNGTVKVSYGASQIKDNINAQTISIIGTTSSNKVIVNTSSNIIVKITLTNVVIQLSNACAFDIQNVSVVELTLIGTNILKSGLLSAGLQVQNTASGIAEVTIGGSGSLDATGGDEDAAGIGGSGGLFSMDYEHGINTDGVSCGKVTIISGTVYANGSRNGAGIGGGGSYKSYKSGGNGGTVIITGGTVIAKGGSWRGAGIGGGGSTKGGAGGFTFITGGDVTAIGGGNAAGIGGGANVDGGAQYAGAAGTIKISNTAKVVAVARGTKPSIDDNDGVIQPDSGTVANVLVINYQSNVTNATTTDVKDASLSSVTSYKPQGEYKSIAFTMPMASYVLYANDKKQIGTISGTTSSVFSVSQGLNIYSDVTNSTFGANVIVKKDNHAWATDTPIIKLSSSPSSLTNEINGSLLNGEYSFSGLEDGTTYYVWEQSATTSYLGESVTIDSQTATVNYYTLAVANGVGTSASKGSGIYLKGKTMAIDTTVNAGYAWNKWTSSNTAILPDQMSKSANIVVPADAITFTATATPISYTIEYTLNSGVVSPINPVSYTIETANVTLTMPTRSGYTFLGWTGSNGMSAQKNVSIPTGSTGNKSYIANWKANQPDSALHASVVTAKSDVSMTIATQTGYEYSLDNGVTWYSSITGSYTFTGLKPNTSYSLIYRNAPIEAPGSVAIASDASAPLTVTTKTVQQTAPVVPTIDSGVNKPTSSRITINQVAGNEYYISTSPTANWSGTPDGYFKATENGIHNFDDLKPATKYYVHVRVAETETSMPSASSSVEQYTLPETPLPSVITIHYVNETINFANLYEVSTSADFTTPLITSGDAITPGTTYFVRKAVSGAVPASESVSLKIASRPEKPNVVSAENIIKSQSSMIITNTVAGQEYQVNGNWYSPVDGKVEVTGLSAGTEYEVITRVKASSNTFASAPSKALIVKTKTAPAVAPTTPTVGNGVNKPTSSRITINQVAGNEYYISTSPTANWSGTPDGYFKATENGIHNFDDLTPATKYYVHVRVAETETSMPSASSSVAQYTLPETPLPSVITIHYVNETINFTNLYEVSTSADFTTPLITSGDAITPGTTYFVRKAVSGAVPASESVSILVPERPLAPTGITSSQTKNKITITPVPGQEYKIGNGAWQDSGNFTNLSAGTDYAVYARVKAVSCGSSSFASEYYLTTIQTKSDGNSSFDLPTITILPTYNPSAMLKDIVLPNGWKWMTPEIVPTVTNSGYGIVYTPTDADVVDYSGVEGYSIDSDGKVTITRNISLTVNRANPTALDFSFLAPEKLEFDGTAKSAVVNVKAGIPGMGAATVSYFMNGEKTVPINAGTYTVKIDVEQGNNFEAISGVTDSSWHFTIAKVVQSQLAITNKPSRVTYGDIFTLGTHGGSGTGAVTWAVTKGSSAIVNENTGEVTITGIGETTITATKASDGNYTSAVTDSYTFIPEKRLLSVDLPSAKGGWTKRYDGKIDFNQSLITMGNLSNKLASDVVNLSVQSATYDNSNVGSANKLLTLTYAIDGKDSQYYLVPNNTVISTATITAATPKIIIKSKNEVYTREKIEMDPATVIGVTGGSTPNGAITYVYYTEETCKEINKTTPHQSGAKIAGGAPINAGTYYVKATIAENGNYLSATSEIATLTIYYPSSGANKSSAPVIVDGKIVDMGTVEVKDSVTTVKVDQNMMSEQLRNAKDSVVIPITSQTDTASAQLVVQNIEKMAERSITLTIKTDGVSYEIPTGAIDTSAILKYLGTSDSSKVPLNVTISKLSKNAINIKDGSLLMAPIEFTITANYNGKNIVVDKFEQFVQRVIEIPNEIGSKTITTAVVMEKDGSQRHVPTDVFSKNGKTYVKINSMTNSTYALIQNQTIFTDTTGKWYEDFAEEMGSRKIISGISKNIFGGERSVTRAEFASMLILALGLSSDEASTFSDVSITAWYSGAVSTAAQYGLVSGKGGNRFDPNAFITRQEAMMMLQKAAKLANYTGTTGNLNGFADAKRVSSWAEEAVKWSVGSGLIVGSGGNLHPNDHISRAESAAVILRLLQKASLIDIR